MRSFPVHLVPATIIFTLFTLLAAGFAALPATAAGTDDPPTADPGSTAPAAPTPAPTAKEDPPATEGTPDSTPERVYLWVDRY